MAASGFGVSLGDGERIADVPFFDGGGYPASAQVMEVSDIVFIRCDARMAKGSTAIRAFSA